MSTPPAAPALRVEASLDIDGMTCAACVGRVERALARTEGIEAASVSLVARQARVRAVSTEALERAIASVEKAGYEARVPPPETIADPAGRALDESRALTRRAALASLGAAVAMVASMPLMHGHGAHAEHSAGFASRWMAPIDRALEATLPWLYAVPPASLRWALLATTAAVLAGPGRPYFVRAAATLRERTADMSTLVALGSGAAFVASALVTLAPGLVARAGLPGDVYFEAAAMTVALVLIGGSLEARARAQAVGRIRDLLARAPETANVVLADGTEHVLPVGRVRPGDRLRARPGERIAVDGRIEDGDASIDESLLTGEPMPLAKGAGQPVYGGSGVVNGSCVYRAERTGAESALARIVASTHAAQASRAPAQRLADRLSAVFAPLVVALAVVAAAAWALAGPEGSRAAYALHALVSVLVVACPCAMGLATPAAVMAAVGASAERGALFKDGAALEGLAAIDLLALDKTGTITEGRPSVASVTVAVDAGLGEDDVLTLAAAVERGSEHPIAQAFAAAARARGLAAPSAAEFEARPGAGARARVGGAWIAVGTLEYAARDRACVAPALVSAADAMAGRGATPVFVARDGAPLAVVEVADEARPTSARALEDLRALGLDVVVLTGDREASARALAARVGIAEVVAGCSPDEKRAYVAARVAAGRRVAMVGDGINDAPALAAASVGISMGLRAAVAVDSADVALLHADLDTLVATLRLARRAVRTMRQNFAWAFSYNLVAIPLAAGALEPSLGVWLEPAAAAGLMALSSVIVVVNSLRLRR